MNGKSIAKVCVGACLMALCSCNNAPQANDTQKSEGSSATELKIAYIDVDSLMSQYTLAVDGQAELQSKATNIQNTLTGKQQQLEAAATKLQQDYENNKLTVEEAQNRQAAIQRQSNDLQVLNQRLSSEFQAETEKFNNALSDSIQHYLALYNKDKHFSFILAKVGDNILLADTSLDITEEVIAGLNKAYKKPKKEKENKEEK